MKIFTGKDRARELNYKNYREMIAAFAIRNGRHWNGLVDNDPTKALHAFVDDGRWVAECECHETFFVEPSEPVAFCANCGNIMLAGKARMVIFPPDRDEIEMALLEREIIAPQGANMTTQDVYLIHLIYPKNLPRHWKNQTVKELRDEHKKAVKHG